MHRACRNDQIVQTALANSLDKFGRGSGKLVEDPTIDRMAENDKIVTRYMADPDFPGSAFPIPAKEIFGAVRANAAATSPSAPGEA